MVKKISHKKSINLKPTVGKIKPKIKIKKIIAAGFKAGGGKHRPDSDQVVDLKKNFSEIYHESGLSAGQAGSPEQDLEDMENELDQQGGDDFDWSNLLESAEQPKKGKKSKKADQVKAKQAGIESTADGPKKRFKFWPFGKLRPGSFGKKSAFVSVDTTADKAVKPEAALKKIKQSSDIIAEDEITADVKKGFPMKIYRKLAVGFIVVALLAVATIVYFVLVRAEILLVLKAGDTKPVYTLSIYDRGEDYVIPDNAVRGLVKVVELEQSKVYPVAGTEVIGQEVIGTITIVNNYDKNQPLVATTRLLAPDGRLYRLTNSVMVPAGSNLAVKVYGDKVDASMAITVDTKLTLPGLWEGLQDKIYANAAAGSVIYQEKKKKIITQAEVDAAQADIKQALLQAAKDGLDESYASYDRRLYQVQDDSLKYQLVGEVGEEKDQLAMTVTGSVVIVVFTESSFYDLAKAKVESSLSDQQQLVNLKPTNFEYKLTQVDLERAIAEVEIILAAEVSFKSDASVVDKQKLVNLLQKQAESYLQGLPEVQSFQIKISPSFVHKMPSLVDRIKIDIKQ